MTIRQIAVVAALGAASLAAQATVVVSTAGNVTTLTENFDGGSSFSAGWNDAAGADDFLHLQGATNLSSFSFSSAQALQSLTVAFWYQVPNAGHGTVAFETSGTLSLPDTPGTAAQALVFNPGPSSPASSSFSATVNNLSAGIYTVTFATTGPLRALRVDDVVITAVSAVPEPGTMALLLCGMGVVGWLAKRRRMA